MSPFSNDSVQDDGYFIIPLVMTQYKIIQSNKREGYSITETPKKFNETYMEDTHFVSPFSNDSEQDDTIKTNQGRGGYFIIAPSLDARDPSTLTFKKHKWNHRHFRSLELCGSQ